MTSIVENILFGPLSLVPADPVKQAPSLKMAADGSSMVLPIIIF